MKKSKLSILLLFLVMILAISAVSAADTNETSDSDLQAVDEAPVDEVASVDVDKLASTDSDNVLSTGGGNFTDLQNVIDTTESVVILNSNYTRVDNEAPVVINKSVTISGNGFTIDGNNNGGIFKINQGSSLTLSNVVLINGNTENGGAIYNEGVLTIVSSQLTNNNASVGGAIYNDGFLILSGSTLKDNNAANGLSIYNNLNMSLTGNTIDGPIVSTGNGVIDSQIKVTVLDNEVKTVKDDTVILTANITDDNGNVINQMGDLFKFTVDGVEVGSAQYNSLLNYYQCIYTLNEPGLYTVNVTYSAGSNLKISSKEKNLRNIKGTYTDLQSMIDASTGTLALSYDITYNDVIDADNFPSGVVIDKAITIDGNGHTISGNNTYRIFNVTANDVVLNNVILTKGNADYGGAIYVDNGGNLTASATFENNTAAYGGAIYSIADLTVDKSIFNNNVATYGAAIDVTGGNLIISESTFNENRAVYNNANATISNSVFASDDVYAIYNLGTLSLAGNKVKAIYSDGTITSDIKVLVLNGSTTVYVDGPNVKLYANITDDNNNPIRQNGFNFIINNANVAANFNDNTLLYESEFYTLPSFGYYEVNMTYSGTATNVEITNGTLTYIAGTFTDLERLISITPAGQTLELPYDFTYNPSFDGTNFPKGIEINKVITIDGKGHTISGNNSNRIFKVTAVTTLNNITFANVNTTTAYGAVQATADLTVANSTFINNVATSNGGAIMAEAVDADVALYIDNVKFIKNSVVGAGAGGGAVGLAGVNGHIASFTIYDSLFEDNSAIDPSPSQITAAGGAIFTFGSVKGLINNTTFRKNKAESDKFANGGAIKFQFGGTLTVANSTFEENEASAKGGAISIQSNTGTVTNVIIDSCKFTDNSAQVGAAVVSAHNAGSGTASISNSNFTEDNAVDFDVHTTATISNSKFTSDKANAIINKGTLELEGNTVKTILNNGTITSQVNATVLDNTTYETKEANYTLTATLTDDNGNLINDTRLKFIVNGATAPNNSTYDATGVYTYADYPITIDNAKYLVSVSLDSATNLVVKTGIVKNLRVGTFTDLKAKLDNATGETFELPYDFTYNADIDGDLKVIVLNKTIDGKGYTISGNNAADIFIVNATVTIKNTIFANVSEFAIKNNAVLTLTNNTISQTNALIINNGTITNAVVNVLDGKTINLKFSQKATLNATFKDENGNLIKDDRFAFSITNVASPIKATYNDGLYTAEYTADKAEIKTVDVANIGIAATVTGTLDISKAEVSITINANETIKRKQNESINITLKDEFGKLLGGMQLQVVIKNSTSETAVRTFTPTTDANGFWSVEVPGLGIENYTINVVFESTDNYKLDVQSKRFEVIELDIANTFTELQRFIQAYEGTDNVLVLPHDFKYNDYVDEDLYAEGVLITKNITIDGNGTTIDSDNVYRILNIANGVTVTIKNVTFINGNASTGAAILTNADSLTIDSCNFLNSSSTDGGAIYIEGGNVNITDAKFINNTAVMGGAIFVAIGGNLTVNGAEFDSNTATAVGAAIDVGQGAILTLNSSKFANNVNKNNYTIINFGTLALDSSRIEEDKVIYNGGKITNPVYSTVLGNATYNIETPTVELTADLLDGCDNKIYDPEFRFVVNGQTVADAPTYNATTGKYNLTLDTTTERAYVVNVASANEENLTTKISILKNITGTFTELQNLIDNATGSLELPYDFAYVAAVDEDYFPEGVVINKEIVIDGKGHAISGSNSNRIFTVTAATTLNNVSLVEGNATEFGGAIYATADLNVYNSTFDSNVATKNVAIGGAIMAEASTADVTLNINNVNFTNNKADYAGGAIAVSGKNGHKVVYNIYDSLFEANEVTLTNGAVGGALCSFYDAKGLINNTKFKGNKAEVGGAISVLYGGNLDVTYSTFENNVATTGGAISVQAGNDKPCYLNVKNCTFTDNNANYHGFAIASIGNDDYAYVTIDGSEFNEDSAVYLDNETSAKISNSKFTSANNFAIDNFGTLELAANTVKVIFNNGTINSQVYSTVLNNKTYDITGTSTYYLNASLVDDNNNKIYDPNLKFVINGETNATVPVYDANKGEYGFTLNITTERIYVVDVTSANEKKLSTKTSIVREITGTFTDLQNQINNAAGSYLNLKYNFTYTPEIDDGSFGQGILISSPVEIDGKGYTIIGNNNERIFNVTANNVVLNNIILVNGTAIAGGAIYVADGGDLTVDTASFENNTAAEGNSIYVADGGKLTVIGTTFNDDYAVYNCGNASISTSEFTSNEVYAIFNLGNLALSGNKVKLIYNYGTITSTVNATFIGGQTIAAELSDEVRPNATLTDDNGNPIFDPKFNITVRDTELETVYDVSSYTYSANYTIVKAGENIVSANYPATKTIGIYDVPKANVTNFTIDVLPAEVPYGENATATITLLGVNGEKLTVYDMLVVVNKTEFYVDIIKGTGSFNISGLAPGTYSALAMFDGNDNYNKAYADDVFDVLEQDITLSVEVGNIDFGDIANVTITLRYADGTPAAGRVSIEVNGLKVILEVENNKTVGFVDLPVGNHTVNATLLPDGLYTVVVNDTETIQVFDSHEVIVPANASETITYGDDLTVEIGQIISKGTNATITGNATIYIYEGDDSTVEPVKTITGINVTEQGATVDGIAGLKAGSYMIIVDFDSTDLYYAGNATVYAKVNKAKVDTFIINTTDAVYGNSAVINITIKGVNEEYLNGTLYITINSEPYELNVTMTDGNYISNVPADYNVGTYTVNVYFEEANGNYEDDSTLEAFEITKATPTLVVNDTISFVYGENIVIPFNISGVDGKGINGTVIAVRPIAEDYAAVIYDADTGMGTISFSILPVGDQLAALSFLSENDNYMNIAKDVNFTITKAEINISTQVTTLEPVYGDDVNFTITVEGLVNDDTVLINVTLFKNGKYYSSDKSEYDREASYVFKDLGAGNYTYAVVYSEDGNYLYDYDTSSFKVAPKQINESDVNVSISGVAPEIATVYIEGPAGVYNVTVDGQTVQVDVVYDENEGYAYGANYIAGLTVGNKTATIAIDNENYALEPFTYEFPYFKDPGFVAIIVNPEIVFEENATVVMKIDAAATGNISVYDNDEYYYTFTVEEAVKGINIPFLSAGNHTITLEYEGDSTFFSDLNQVFVTVAKATPAIQTNVTENPKVGDNVTINVTVDVVEEGNVTITVDGREILSGETDHGGLASAVVDFNLAAGEHFYTITFAGTDNYMSNTYTGSFNVSKNDPVISIVVDNMDNLSAIAYTTLTVTVAEGDATGYILIKGLDAIIYEELQNGAYILDPLVLLAGDYEINVTYYSDDKYSQASAAVEFTVAKGNATPVITEVTTPIKTGEDVSFIVNMDNDAANGNVTIYVDDDVEGQIIVLDSEYANASVTIEGLLNGTHTIGVKYNGNDNFNESDVVKTTVVVEITVINPDDVKVEIDAINYYPDGVNVTITAPVDGNYAVTVNGTVINVEVVDSTGIATITGLEPGIYNATVDIAKEGYSLETITTDEFKYLITPEFNVVITGTYPTAEISITGPEGTYHVLIGEKEYNITRVASGLPTIEEINIDAGNYTATVSFEENDKYYSGSKDINFTVLKAGSNVTIVEPIADVVYGNTVVITFSIENMTDFVTASISNDKTPDVPEEFNYTYGKITAVLPAGSYTVRIHNGESANYLESEYEAYFTVFKAENLTITYDGDLVALGGGTVNITVAPDATGYVVIDNDGFTKYGDLVNGSFTFDIYDLTAGDYTIVVDYHGDNNYNETSATKVLTIAKANATLEITNVTTPIKTGEDVSFVVTMGPDAANGNVTIYVDDDVEGQIIVLDSEYANASVTIEGLLNGTHTIGVKYNGNDNFNESDVVKTTVVVEINVINPDDVKVEINSTNYYPDGVNVTITAPVDGNYTVTVNGTVTTVEVVNSIGIATITGLEPGIYNATVNIAKEGYSLETITTDEFKYLITPEFNVVITGTYPTAEISITGPEGTYHVLIGEKEYNITRVASGLPTIEEINIDAGNYTATVLFDENDKYYSGSKDVDFTVLKAGSNVTIVEPIADVVYGNTVVITFSIENMTDFVTASISNDKTPDVPEEFNYTYGKITAVLPAGSYTVRIHNGESANYLESEYEAYFTVFKAENLTVTYDGDLVVFGGGTVNITVAPDATGYVVIYHDGGEKYANLVNGSFTFDVYDLTAGDYTIVVDYYGDDNYNKTSATKVLTVPKGNTTIEISDVTAEIVGGEDATFVVNVVSNSPNGATGNITVYINGEFDQVVILDDEYNNATVTLEALPQGTYTIGVRYNGNGNYNASDIVNTTVNVSLASSEVIVRPVADSYDGSVLVFYSIFNETGVSNVIITYLDDPSKVIDYTDFNGIVNITDLAAGKYSITIENIANDYYAYSNATQTFTVYDNVVTNDTFYGYFDDEGVLLDVVPFDELIFKGAFRGLGTNVIVINRPILLDSESRSLFFNMGLRIDSADVFVSDLMFLCTETDFTQSNGCAVIYVNGEDVSLDRIVVGYVVPAGADPYGIYVIDSDGFTLTNSVIYLSANENNTHCQQALRVSDSDDVSIGGNLIYADLPLRDVNYSAIGLDQDLVLAVGIENGDEIEFSYNNVTVRVIGEITAEYPTLAAVMVYNVEELSFVDNNISIEDSSNTGAVYYYALNLELVDGIVEGNTILVNTTTGASNAGAAYPIQITGPFDMVVYNNTLTAISNGPTIGIYATNWGYLDSNLTAMLNTIQVTGLPTNSSSGLVSGIELQVFYAEVYQNTIYALSTVDYADDLNIYGISFAQATSWFTGEYKQLIKENEIFTDSNYAIYIAMATDSEVMYNYLIAHDKYGDGAVNITEGNTVFFNCPQDLNLTVNVENVTVVDPVEVYVSTNPLFNGTVTVNINGIDYEIDVIDGQGGEMLSSLPASNYTAYATYAGSVEFLGDLANCTFEIFRLVDNMTIATGDIIVDEPLEVNVTYGYADGELYVTVDDGEVFIVNMTDGFATFIIPRENVTATNHTIFAFFGQTDDYVTTYQTYKFEVAKAENYTFEINLTVDEINYGENTTFNVTLPEDANGIITVCVNGQNVTSESVVNGTATVTVPADAFETGFNVISVSYSDDKYGETTAMDAIYVNHLPSNLTASAENIELGQNATIVINLTTITDGVVSVVLLGETYTPVDGKLILENLTEGTYTAEVYFNYDSVYKDNYTTVTFNVTKVVIPPEQAFNITTPENATSQVISVELPEDATGFLLLDVNGTQTFVPLENGKANVTVPKLLEGAYNATITYTGDSKYAPITTTQEINVTSNVPENALSIPESGKSDAPTTYSISLPSDAKGYLEVDVDGTKHVAPLVNGSASVTVPALSAGDHNVTVTYTGDGNYSPVVKNTKLSVSNPVFKLTENKNINVIYSAKATYKVLVTRDGKAVGAGEKVTIKFNGKTYTVKTNAKGYATLKLNTKVKVKKYTITATYKGVTVKNTVKVKHIIKVGNKKVKNSKSTKKATTKTKVKKSKKSKKSKVIKVKIYLKKVNGKYLKGKKITVKFKGKKYKVKTNKKGKAVWKLKKSIVNKLKPGKKYKYVVTYGKDKVTKKLTIKK